MRRRDDEIVEEGEGLSIADDPGIVTSLARGLGVLRAFRRTDSGLGNQELAARTGLPKATVSRLTYTLSRLGYLVYRPETANYRLGTGVLALGLTTLGAMGIREVARPVMQDLADHCGGAVAMGTRDGMAMMYLETCHGSSTIQIALEAGSHLKLATSAIGRAYLAGLSPAERAPMLRRLEAREGRNWPAIRRGIEAALDNHGRLGFVV
ncbi:MAG: IclR family transcriptional regulator, partial [Rhizobiaceae bacterium]|nr:IclR family transcriptional regulator [Rhizobiaceae bacterium]